MGLEESVTHYFQFTVSPTKRSGCSELRQITHRAAVDASGEEFRESLYKGALGAALLVEDLKQPRLAAMPFFEPTG